MRRVDKKHNMRSVNKLAEQRYIQSKVILLNEIITAGGYTFYHRTPVLPTLFNHGFIPGGGDTHGAGLYGCYDLNQQIGEDMGHYGKYLTEFTLNNSAGIVILDYVQSKKVNGSKYTLLDQLDKIMGPNFKEYYKENKRVLDQYQSELSAGLQFTGYISEELWRIGKYHDWVDGTSYTGHNDGPCIVLFNTNLANPIRYSVDNAKTWVNIKDNKDAYNIGKDERGLTRRQHKIVSGEISFDELESDDEKLYSCNKSIERGVELNHLQWRWASDEIKLADCNNMMKSRFYFLNAYQFKWASDEMKMVDCEKEFKKYGILRRYQFTWAPNEMKMAVCDNTLENRGFLNDYHFAWAPNEMKMDDCNRTIKKYGYLDDFQWEWAPDEVKLSSCKKVMGRDEYLSDYQFAWAPDELKMADCKRKIEKKGHLDDYHKEWYDQYKQEHP